MNETIALGGRQFEIRPLKLGQLRHLLDALDGMTGKSGGALIEAATQIVVAGLAPAHPDLTHEAVLDLEATVDELNAAVAAILQVAGLKPAGEAQPVASPDQLPGSGSLPSMEPSPPAASIPTA
jgi:hypothetical protein